MRARSAHGLLVVTMVVTACSSDTTAPPPTMTASTPVTVEASTTSVTSTTTTVPEPTAPPTDPPPPTTTPDDAIRQAVQDYWAAYWQCGQSPAACDPSTFTAPGSVAFEASRRFVADLVSFEFYFSGVNRQSQVYVESAVVDGPAAVTRECLFDAGVVLGPDDPNGAPTVINDVVESAVYEHEWTLTDVGWRVVVERKLEVLGEGNQCDAA